MVIFLFIVHIDDTQVGASLFASNIGSEHFIGIRILPYQDKVTDDFVTVIETVFGPLPPIIYLMNLFKSVLLRFHVPKVWQALGRPQVSELLPLSSM